MTTFLVERRVTGVPGGKFLDNKVWDLYTHRFYKMAYKY